MKVAALCDFPYWEENVGTAVRYESLCQSLAKVCDLTVISSVTLPKKYADFARRAPYNLVDLGALKDLNILLGEPKIPGVRADRQMVVATIKHYCEAHGIEAVLTPYFNRHWMVEHLSPQIVRIVDTHDCQSQRTRSFARHGLMPTFLMTPEKEAALLAQYDMALAMSDEDYAEFTAMTDISVVTAPFRLPAYPVYSARGVAHEVLFIAAKSPINDLTLDYLLRDVLPLVQRPLTLHVVGNVTMSSFTPPNVKIVRHENVEDVAWIYGAMDLALNPTYAGGGVKTKTLEAIRFGVPILTSDEGARGMRNLLPDALVVNDKETFAYKIRELLDDPALRLQLSQDMLRNLAEENSESWLDGFQHILKALRAGKLEGLVQ